MTEPRSTPTFHSYDEWRQEVNQAAYNAASLWKHHSAKAAEQELAALWRLFENEPPQPTALGRLLALLRRRIAALRKH